MVMTNTIDERLAKLFSEKGESAQLALDGRLNEERAEQVDLADDHPVLGIVHGIVVHGGAGARD